MIEVVGIAFKKNGKIYYKDDTITNISKRKDYFNRN